MECGPDPLRHRYELLEKLGQGTMGRVHRARRRADGVEFVVKQIGLSGFSETSRADILNEVCVMRQLEHPNVVAYEESFVLDDELSIVMEHLVGGDMGGAIKSRGGEPLPEEEVWDMLIQLTEGLHHLHERRVLHRDIKLENIFVDGRGAVKIGDLGLGRLLSTRSSHARTGVGTPLYFSPEMCEERPYNEKSDVWALGCLIYELCCFAPPFAASNQVGRLRGAPDTGWGQGLGFLTLTLSPTPTPTLPPTSWRSPTRSCTALRRRCPRPTRSSCTSS